LHRPLSFKRSQWISILFRFVGLVLLVAGPSLVFAARSAKLLPGSIGVSSAKQLSAGANREGNYGETIALTTRALRWAPIDWQLYLARAIGGGEPKKAK